MWWWWWWWWWWWSSSSSSTTAAATIIVAIFFFIWRDISQWAITHNDAPQPVGLPWTSDQPVAETIPDNTQHSQQTDIHAPGGIQTHNLSRHVATDLCLRPRSHWNRQQYYWHPLYNLGCIPLTPDLIAMLMIQGNIGRIHETKKCIATTGMPTFLH